MRVFCTKLLSKSVLAAALAVLSVSTLANEYTVCRMPAAPAIDGRADDPGWQSIPWAYGFRNLYEKYAYSLKQQRSK